MSNHSKHTKLTRRENDNYAPNEVAILGTNCSNIANLARQIASTLTRYRLAYFDASHALNTPENILTDYVFHPEGNLQIQTKCKVNPYQQKLDFAPFDLVLINGNHYQGAKQILILDDEKEASLLKRIEQLTNIECIIKLKKSSKLFDFLVDRYHNIKHLPIFEWEDIEPISNQITKIIQDKTPPLQGLILMGGKSTRMGTNKAELHYFDKPQKEFVKDLLVENGLEAYYSVRPYDFAQGDNESLNIIKSESEKSIPTIPDTFLNLGPFGGICSAFQQNPNTAWLVLAIDVPFVSKYLIRRLIEGRNPSKIVTAIKGKNKEFVEPLITIYEPKAYPILLQYLAQGYSCPRKVLINNEVEIIEVDDDLIRNINTPQEFEIAKKELNS